MKEVQSASHSSSGVRTLHVRRSRRLKAGHLWVFSNDLLESPKQFEPGSLVDILDRKDEFLGTGYINPHSLIAVRLLTGTRRHIDRGFFLDRASRALALRERLAAGSDAFRVIYSEADGLPGLIADKYGDCLVLQFLTLGMETFREVVIDVLGELLMPKTIVLRNDSRMRLLEGLGQEKYVLKGDLDQLPIIQEDGLRFEIDPMDGQKTGFFLDQRENRSELRRFLRGGRGLDLFCYQGAWALHLASAGIDVICVDSSERALERARRNAGLNGLADRLLFRRDDVFSFLESQDTSVGGRYEVIVLDPPAFVKSAAKINEAIRAYRELNARCMRLLAPGGILATSSCSYHLAREDFLKLLRDAARDSGRTVRLLALRSQAPDHPVLLAMPETEYLKCAFLIVD